MTHIMLRSKPLDNIVLIFMLFMAIHPAASAFDVITLRHQSAEQMIPSIKPLMNPGSVITGTGYKLIISATPDELNKVRVLIQQLDIPIQLLIVSVSQDHSVNSEIEQKSLSGHIEDENTRIIFGQQRNRDGISISTGGHGNYIQGNMSERRDQKQHHVNQQVRVLSGSAAFIQVGNIIPISQQQVLVNRDRRVFSKSTIYQDVTSGFYITPRLAGNGVNLEITTNQQHLSHARSGVIDTQRTSSSIHGQLGEWIELGSADDIMSNAKSGVLNRQQRKSIDTRRIYVKVDIASGASNNQFIAPAK